MNNKSPCRNNLDSHTVFTCTVPQLTVKKLKQKNRIVSNIICKSNSYTLGDVNSVLMCPITVMSKAVDPYINMYSAHVRQKFLFVFSTIFFSPVSKFISTNIKKTFGYLGPR